MIAIILIVAFSLRVLPRILLPYAIADDGYEHLSSARQIRENRFRVPAFYDKSLFAQIFGYPFLVLYIFGLFPKRAELWAERLISPICDTLLITVSLLLFSKMIPGRNDLFFLYGLSLSLLPAYLRNDVGPRAYQGSARVLAQLLFIAMVSLYCQYIDSQNTTYYFLALLPGAIIFLSSTFGSQVFAFGSLIIACVYSWKILIFLVLAFLLFYLLTLGKASQIIRARAGHYEWFFKFYQRIYYQKWGFLKNPIRDYAGRVKHWMTLLLRGKFSETLKYVLTVNNPLHILLTCFFFYLSVFSFGTNSEAYQFLNAVAISCFSLYLITMLKPLLFLGESYRYLEFGAPVALLLFFSQFKENTWLPWFISGWIVVSFLQYLFYQIEFYRNYKKENDNFHEYERFFLDVNNKVDGNVIVSVHFRTKAAYFGNFSYLGNRGIMNLKHLSLEDNFLAFGKYPHPGENYRKLIERFNVKYWLIMDEELEDYCGSNKDAAKLSDILFPVVSSSALKSSLHWVNENNLTAH
jgi:hypothetical protein